MNKNFNKFILVTFVITSFFTQLVYSQGCDDENSGVTWDTTSQRVKKYSFAKTYCEDQGKRLPTTSEFNKLTSTRNQCADNLTRSSRDLTLYVTSTSPTYEVTGLNINRFYTYFIAPSHDGKPYHIVSAGIASKNQNHRGLAVVCVQD